MTLVVGAGIAALRAIESMRASGHSGRIRLVGDEPYLPYERPPLSKGALGGELALEPSALAIQPGRFFDDERVELVLGRPAVRLDTGARHVDLADGTRLAFEQLLIATGSRPVALPVAGAELANVLSLRGIDDARRLRSALLDAERVLVVGAGLVGLEVAAVARGMGKRVIVVERSPRPLDRLLGGHVIAESVRALHEANGVEVRTSTTVRALIGERRVEHALLSDGDRVAADVVVTAIGIRPSTAWLAGSGLAVDDGVLVDEYGMSNASGIFAAGDVARMRDAEGRLVRLETYGHAHSQGIAVGRTMAGAPTSYVPFPAASSEQHGVRLQVVGTAREGQRVVVRGELERRAFAGFFLDEESSRVTGVLAMNRPRDVPLARRLIESRERVDPRQLASA